MLKGNTKIELTNIHTGKKEVVEKHNLITNHLKNTLEWLHAWGFTTDESSKLQSRQFPVYDKCMGGIILFGNTLTDNANNVMLPMAEEDDVVGYASNDVNTTENQKRGNRNIVESEKVSNGYKMVWDFGTSQANGVISAVALTDAYACARSGIFSDVCNCCGSVIKQFPSNVIQRKIVDYDVYTDKVTYLDLSSSSTLTLRTATFNSNKASLEGFNIYEELDSKQVQLSVELPLGGWWQDGKDGYYYYCTTWYNNDNVSDTNNYYDTIKMARVKKDTLEVDASIGLKTIKLPSMKWSQPDCMFCICNGYVYFGGSTNRNYNYVEIDKIDLVSSQVIKRFDEFVDNYGAVYSINNIVYAGSKCILPNDELIQKSEDAGYGYIFSYAESSTALPGLWQYEGVVKGKVLTNDKGQIMVVDSGRIYYGFLLNNLCTINNLEEPVTKTSDKTMKITYILTEE